MELTLENKLSLAALKTNSGFLTLLAIFDDQIKGLQSEILNELNNERIVLLVRELQFYSRIYRLLQEEPEIAAEELAQSETYGRLLQYQLPLK
jgi:hypothetical protein